MVRRTISLPSSADELVRDNQRAGESYSAAAVRLILEGAAATGTRRPPRYVGSGRGPADLGRLAEQYLRDAVPAR